VFTNLVTLFTFLHKFCVMILQLFQSVIVIVMAQSEWRRVMLFLVSVSVGLGSLAVTARSVRQVLLVHITLSDIA